MNRIKEFIRKLFGSLDTHQKDVYSARKITACVIIVMAVIVGHILFYRYATAKDSWTLYPEILLIDYFMVAVCLGLATWSEYQKAKNEKKTEEQPKG
jgi:hypothetical protein